MTLKGDDPRRRGRLRAIRIDSALEDFERVARHAAAAAHANRVALTAATRANFDALGIDLVAYPAPAAG